MKQADGTPTTKIEKLPTAAPRKVTQPSASKLRQMARDLDQHPAKTDYWDRISTRRGTTAPVPTIEERLVSVIIAKIARHFQTLSQQQQYDYAVFMLVAIKQIVFTR